MLVAMEEQAVALNSLARINRVRAHDAAMDADALPAIEQIMRLHNQRLYRLAFGLLGDASEAEDALQESYWRAFQKLSTIAADANLGAWLASIVRNQAIDQLRARRARQARFTLEADLPHADDQPSFVLERARDEAQMHSPEICLDCDEMRQLLEQAIATLPARFRAVFMLREVEGLSLQETAEYLDIAVATVKTRDHRARKMLRDRLGTPPEAAEAQAFEFLRDRCDRIVEGVLARLLQ